ncbi:miniconductance mechanosensitive channel [Saccharicrinis carchari]|uniref:Miniconductance mechanosensitive channel n=1 Tax=Saccharicrinis carchari TaxID=1168039 RepID=A0A521EL80_SACCC|nr:mechanosensitive ion channel domain-containing protein [Saccharicrinis carchari]SMO84678.1 miniconductance mechanosensitive channel [Saccharicrinis carchari]
MSEIINETKIDSNFIDKWINEMLLNLGFSENIILFLKISTLTVLAFVIARIAHHVAKKILVRTAERAVKRTKSKYDDYIVNRKLLSRTSYLIPAMVIKPFIDWIFKDMEDLNLFLHNLVSVYFIVIILLMIDSTLKVVQDIYATKPYAKERPIKGYLQGANLVFILIGILTSISILSNVELLAVFTGLGAIAAVLLLVFKDTILGFVASIQLSVNDMVRLGDWVSMPSHNADGDVIEMTLNTVKIQNFDKTISTVPTYALISESFINWRGMKESGGRRIKRSISIDMKSVHFCTPEMIDKFKKVRFLRSYIDEKLEELKEYNQQFDIDESSLINGRRLTNLGVFRKYMESYLKHHPHISKDMTFLIRHLQPNEKGIPIEIYVFSDDTRWAIYEGIQADIFDHILAVLPEFGLKVFQFPTELSTDAGHLES